MNGPALGQWPDQPPRAHQLMAVIRSLVASGVPMTLSDHADQRLYDRDLDMSDVLRAFRIGDVVGPIEAGKNRNEWTCTVVSPVLRNPEVSREIGVYTVVIEATSLLIGTIKWVDEA